MPSARRSLLLGVCSLLLVSGCGSSSYSSDSGPTNSTGGGTSGTGSAGGGPTGNPIGGSTGPTGSNNWVVATPSVAGNVSVVVGAQQTVSISFNSSDGSAISGFGISGSLGSTLPAGWSGPSSLTCASISTGSGCVLNLTYAPTAVGSGTVTINYVYVDNATMPSTGGSLTIAYAATAHNNVVAAASQPGQIDAIVGGDQPVSVNFTTDDGNAATGLALTTDLSTLPAGWSSTASSLSCAIVSTGSGCELPLTYAPTAASRGTLTLNYSYTDNSGATRTGALNIPYSTSSHDDVTATVSPSGEINAIEKSGGQAVAVTFTTDDGKPATGVYVTSLAALPPGWSRSSKSFACSSVSTGNGCQLHLTYAPAALTKGTLVLNYAYTDGAGMAKTGSLNVAYAATTDDNVVATASPTGQINAVVGLGTQAVTVAFTTDDGRPATALQLTSSLSSLPPGWSSSATSFSCSGLGGGSACQLPLTYAPSAAGSGMLSLSYAYKNDAGVAKTGSLNIAYRATTNDSIVGTPSQSPLAVITNSTTTVSVVFTTDDGNLASNLAVTSGLGTLPSGWTSTSSTFTCSAVSTGTGCQLSLTYAPTAVGRGTVSLNYSYNDDSGTAKTGSVSIPYSAKSPPHLYVAQLGGLVSYCVLNADGTLSSCAPTGDSFTAPTGIVFNGGNFAYVADNNTSNAVYLCNVGLDGTLSGCAPAGSNFQSPWQLAISGTTLYATNLTGGATICTINSDGTLAGCILSPGTGTAGIAASSGYAYIGSGPNVLDVCAIGVSGSLSGCTTTGSGFVGLDGISLSGGYAYVANENGGSVSVCSINTNGSLSGCTLYGVGVAPTDVVISGNLAYINDASSGNVYLCPVVAGGALGSCTIANAGASFSTGIQIAIH